MRITLPDAVADAYLAYAEKQGRPVEAVLTAQLQRFQAVEPGSRTIVLGGALTEQLSTMLGGFPIQSAEDLVRKVNELAAVSFQHIRLDFSPSHLRELAHRAERQGKPVEDIIQDVVRQLADQFFWTSGAGEAVLVPAER